MKRCTVCGEYKESEKMLPRTRKCRPCFNRIANAAKQGKFIQEQFCQACEQVLPAVNFPIKGKRLSGWCLSCVPDDKHAWCRRCGIVKSINVFHTKNVCQQCIRFKEKERSLRRYYDLSGSEFDTFLREQSFKCAICESEGKLVVDHNHKTKEVRALLCLTCNTGLGAFKDSPKLLQTAIEYLDKCGNYADD